MNGLEPLGSAPSTDDLKVMRLIERAILDSTAGRHRRALRFCQRILRRNPTHPQVRALRALVFSSMGRYEDALTDQAAAHAHLGTEDPALTARNAFEASRTCHALGRGEDALEWLHTAFRFDPAFVADALVDAPELAGVHSRLRIMVSSEDVPYA